MVGKNELRIHWDMYRDVFPAVIRVRDTDREITHVGRITFEPLGNEAICYEPSFELRREQVQVLMDDLWMAGIRPSTEGREADVIDAQKEHLKSLRESVSVLHAVVHARMCK